MSSPTAAGKTVTRPPRGNVRRPRSSSVMESLPGLYCTEKFLMGRNTRRRPFLACLIATDSSLKFAGFDTPGPSSGKLNSSVKPLRAARPIGRPFLLCIRTKTGFSPRTMPPPGRPEPRLARLVKCTATPIAAPLALALTA